ncbi:hypothetical protein M9H77_04189 [Catharanthus roseus]|uniref:Uncharacterized protein n=1 Tax=Catharanthus roseus TaxID=4058 RepID=A0ACC0CDV3_CATRO|nr:hypothetical protein M9H77_04189 [Catharanthus roseus]
MGVVSELNESYLCPQPNVTSLKVLPNPGMTLSSTFRMKICLKRVKTEAFGENTKQKRRRNNKQDLWPSNVASSGFLTSLMTLIEELSFLDIVQDSCGFHKAKALIPFHFVI